MIVKVLSRHSPSYGSLIEYLAKDGKSKNGKPAILTHNFKGTIKEEWVQELMQNEAFRRYPKSTQIFLYHTIISLSNKENNKLITEDVLKDLANQYINLRGTDGMYLLAFHDDKEHQHIHVLESGLKYYTGMAHRITPSELYELKQEFQLYHERTYPFIESSSPQHGSGKEYDKDNDYWNKSKRTSVKEAIKDKVQALFNQSQNQNQFLQSLQSNNLFHYERNGKITGIVHDDLKFRFSRLGIDLDEKPKDPVLTNQEQEMLEQIQSLRESHLDNEKSIEMT